MRNGTIEIGLLLAFLSALCAIILYVVVHQNHLQQACRDRGGEPLTTRSGVTCLAPGTLR